MIDVTVFSAFLGGVLTFLAPCTLPLVPAYIAFLAGGSETDKSDEFRSKVRASAFLFVIGFTFVFMFFGLVSGVVGKFFILHRALISEIGGVIIVVFGLSMLGVPLPAVLRNIFRDRPVPKWIKPGSSRASAFILGFLFALGWSPCLGPILGTILLLAAGASATALHGAFLLFVYALGLALPFLFIAYAYEHSLSYISFLSRYAEAIARFGGFFLVLIGVSLVLGQFGTLNEWALRSFGSWYARLVDYM